MFADNLALFQLVDVHGRHTDGFAGGGHAHERLGLGAAHRETNHHLVAFCNDFFGFPLYIGHGTAHHAEHIHIAFKTVQRLRRCGGIENHFGGDNGFTHRAVARVDEADKLLHDLFVFFQDGCLFGSYFIFHHLTCFFKGSGRGNFRCRKCLPDAAFRSVYGANLAFSFLTDKRLHFFQLVTFFSLLLDVSRLWEEIIFCLPSGISSAKKI